MKKYITDDFMKLKSDYTKVSVLTVHTHRSKLSTNILFYNCVLPTNELHEIVEAFVDKWQGFF